MVFCSPKLTGTWTVWVWWWHRRDGTLGWEFGAPHSVKAKQKRVFLSPTLGEKRCPCPPYAGTFISIYASIFFPIICYEEKEAWDWELKDRFQVSPPLSIRCGLMATLLASPGSHTWWVRDSGGAGLPEWSLGLALPSLASLTATREDRQPGEQGSCRETGGAASLTHLTRCQHQPAAPRMPLWDN